MAPNLLAAGAGRVDTGRTSVVAVAVAVAAAVGMVLDMEYEEFVAEAVLRRKELL